MMIQIALKIGTTPFTAVVSDNASCGERKHDRANRYSQPGWIHVSLLGFVRIAAQSHGRRAQRL
ncbi:hypothetical protein [Paraburkholderia mimosarum]|uniref:hypothetical protein n=1 Tax=Paraburkholderia mimosarum TaxID=312026 RepID=UPI0004207CD9|nr:hypothetical protein [Paraburkholderia mimosarum]